MYVLISWVVILSSCLIWQIIRFILQPNEYELRFAKWACDRLQKMPILVLISWMVTLSSCLTWQIISFSLPTNEYGCVYAWTMLGSGPAIDLQKMQILAKKKHLFRWSSFWSWQVCKQSKLWYLLHRKPARIYWNADAPKTSPCLVRILLQRHN